MPASAKSRVQMIIRGRVQGVYYRASAANEARRLGLTGWVMNRRNGAVEIVAEGPPAQLEELIAWCRQGPPGARVDHIDLERQDFCAEFADFRIRHAPD